MSERLFRLILGSMLYIALTLAILLESQLPIYIVIVIISFEAITNWRVPIIVTRLRYGKEYKEYLDQPSTNNECTISNFTIIQKIEAERFLRIVVLAFVAVPYIIQIDGYSHYIEFIPWFVATMLVLAGVTNICPMVMFLRLLGMR